MVPSQIDRASSVVGVEQTDSVSSHQNWVTKARAKRWASGKDLGSRWQGDCLRRGASASLPSSYSQLGKGGDPAESTNYCCTRLKAPRS